MEKYQIIPRKFRPSRFAEVVGHAPIVQTLKNALNHDRIAQAYLFCGGRGCGKTTLARLLAKALNCQNRGADGEPCNQCASCQEIMSGQSLNVLEIDGASNRGIEDIRQLNETVGYASTQGGYKIYIIDEVHMLTKEAFNALLKTLEEPPSHVKFFFATTEPHKIPATILSRCQRFDLRRIGEKPFIDKLTRIAATLQVDIEAEALQAIYGLSEGSLRDGESLLDQLICHGKRPITLAVVEEMLGLVSHKQLATLDEAIHTQKLTAAFPLAQEMYRSGLDVTCALDRLLEHFRNYLLISLGEVATEKYVQWAPHYTKDHLFYLLDTLVTWQNQMRKAPFKEVHLEMLLLQLIRSKHQPSLGELVQRLIALEEPGRESPALPSVVAAANKPIADLPTPPKRPAVQPTPPPEPKKEAQAVAPPPKKEAQAAIPPINKPIIEMPTPPKRPAAPPSRDDTLIRFAAVELEGTVTQQRS